MIYKPLNERKLIFQDLTPLLPEGGDMRVLYSAIFVLLLVGCGQEARIKERVKESLRDPESARFVRISVADQGKVACGTVNAKNSFGGYVGNIPFMFYNDHVRFANTENERQGIALVSCCYSALRRANGMQAVEKLDLDMEADCMLLDPPVQLDPVAQK